jgi:hypothetical protein
MPARKESKLSKSQLLQEIDEKLQDLNLLRSALQGDSSRTQDALQTYQQKFYELVNIRPKK